MSEEERIKPITDPRQMPSNLSDEEQLEYWETHGLTEEFLEKTEEVPARERPRPRAGTQPISVRIDARTLDRLKKLAEMRGVGYQTLLKDFVTERLYEEEKREGILPADVHLASALGLSSGWLEGDTPGFIPLKPLKPLKARHDRN